jgi:hypothetical protein
MTVNDSVWCAKPPRRQQRDQATGLVTLLTNIIPIISTAPSVKAQRRASIRWIPRRWSGSPPPPGRTDNRDPLQETQPREHRAIWLYIEAAQRKTHKDTDNFLSRYG